MIYLSLTVAMVSQLGVLYFLYTKSSETKESIVLIIFASVCK